MGVRDTFKMSWEKAVMRAALARDTEIFPERRIILRNVHIGKFNIAEYIIIYGDSEYPVLIVTRFSPDFMLLPAFIHLKEQRSRIVEAGYQCNISYREGLIQCTYSKKDYPSYLVL